MTSKVARIVWLPATQGGRTKPPTGSPYIAPAGFGPASLVGADAAHWSLVAELVSKSADGLEWIANVRFLVPEAPVELLADDADFSFFEGERCVAHGTLLPSPSSANIVQQQLTSPHPARHA